MTNPIDLDLYTDSTAMRALLQAQLPGFADGGLHIDALGVHSARRGASLQRNPRPMTLCYELQVSDAVRGRTGPQLLVAEVFRDGGAAAAFARQDRTRFAPPAFGEPLVHLPGLNLLLWALPNDPGLPQLSHLFDPGAGARWLACDAGAEVQVELLRYEPQRRATLRYTLAGGAGGTARTVYAKTFSDDRAADIDARFRHFWQAAPADPGAPLVAQPLGFDAATRTVWQAPAVGVPLREALGLHGGVAVPVQDAQALLRRVAHAWARLHAAPLAPGADAVPRTVAHWLAEVQRRSTKIGRADVRFAARAERVVAIIKARADRQALRPLSLIHGDCHPDQVWVHDDRVVLFDFDEFTLGDPMEDLASFVLKLELDGATPALVAAFIAHWEGAAPQRFERDSLAWHLAVQSLLQASRAFVYQRPGWAHTLECRLAACEARAAALLTP